MNGLCDTWLGSMIIGGGNWLLDGLTLLALGVFGTAPTDSQGPVTWADYNTQVVLIGTSCLGFAAGLVGCFALLRRQALVGDALSHATLPGIAAAFLLAEFFGGDGKRLEWLLLGATCSGILGMWMMMQLERLPRIKPDAAMGIILSVFFGAGIVLVTIVQQTEAGHAAGLESFIYGKAASMLRRDTMMIASMAVAVSVVVGLFFKELKLLCFDEGFALARGYPVSRLNALILALVTVVTVIGLQAVGLILIIALLVIPPSAARFWTNSLGPMCWISAGIGAMSAAAGAIASAWAPDLPSGPMMVMTCSGIFAISLICGPARGVLARLARRRDAAGRRT